MSSSVEDLLPGHVTDVFTNSMADELVTCGLLCVYCRSDHNIYRTYFT